MYAGRFIVPIFLAFGVLFFFRPVSQFLLLRCTPAIPAGVVSRLCKTDDHKRVIYEVTYLYQPEAAAGNAPPIEGSDELSEAEFHELYRQTVIRIHAAKLGPWRLSTLDRTPCLCNHGFELLFALVWMILGSAMLYGALVGPRRARKLVSEGQPVMGKIVRKRIVRGKVTAYIIEYEFTPRGNDSVPIRERETVGKRWYQQAAEGQSVTVLYDAERPRRHCVYELCGFEVKG